MKFSTKVVISVLLSLVVVISSVAVSSLDGRMSPYGTMANRQNTSQASGPPTGSLFMGANDTPPVPTEKGSISLGFDGPSGLAYDPANGYVYLANAGGNFVSVISSSTNQIVGNISVGNSPGSMALDSLNGKLFVALNNKIAVVSTTNNSVVSLIQTGSYSSYMTFDSRNGYLYVSVPSSGYSRGLIQVYNGTTDSLVLNITGIGDPLGSVVDSSNGDVYVANQGRTGVYVINGTANALEKGFNIGGFAYQIAYDPVNHRVYATSYKVVTIFNGSSNKLIGNFSVVSGLYGITVDGPSGNLFLTDDQSGDVYVVSTARNNTVKIVQTGGDPVIEILDPANGLIYISVPPYALRIMNGSTGDTIETLSPGTYPAGVDYNRASGEIYVANRDTNTVQAFNPLTGKQTALIRTGGGPFQFTSEYPGDNLFVSDSSSNQVSVIDALTNKVNSTANIVNTGPGGLSYDGSNGLVYVADTDYNGLSVLNGTTGKLLYNFSVGFSQLTNVFPAYTQWDSLNNNLYLTYYQIAYVTEINTTSNKQVRNIPTSSATGGIALDTWNGFLYVSLPALNSVAVINTTSNLVTGKIPVGQSPGAVEFDPYNGLIYVANENSNNISVINGATNTVMANLIAGDYPASMAFDYANGYIYVANLYSNNLTILGTTSFNAAFREEGLASGAWFVNITGTENLQSGPIKSPTFSFHLPAGAYHYTVSTDNRHYQPENSSQVFHVSNSGLSFNILFKSPNSRVNANSLIYLYSSIVMIAAMAAGLFLYYRKGRK